MMKLNKRDCGIEMSIKSYAGWTDVDLEIQGDKLSFVISNVFSSFEDLMHLLWSMYPKSHADHPRLECKYAVQDLETCKTIKIVDDCKEADGCVIDVPWKGDVTWDAEGSETTWTFERDPTEKLEFDLKIEIDMSEGGVLGNVATAIDQPSEPWHENHSYVVPYKDFCYAVAKAYTNLLKRYGFIGYRECTNSVDIAVRYLLCLKEVALDCPDEFLALRCDNNTYECFSSFGQEIELLLFDM